MKKRYCLQLAFLLSLLISLLTNAAKAAIPPVNDDCVGAITLNSSTVQVMTAGTTLDATASNLAVCAPNALADDDVWYKFIALTSTHRITVEGVNGFNAAFEVYGGSCATTGAPLKCSNFYSNPNTEIANVLALNPGQIYYIRVFNADAGSGSGVFNVSVQHGLVIPGNDYCTAATLMASANACNTIQGTTNNASPSDLSASCGDNDDDVWYKFAAVSNTHSIQVFPQATNFNPAIEVFNAKCGSAANRIICVNSSPVGAAETVVISNLTVGDSIFYRVFHTGAGGGGNVFSTCVSHPAQTCTYALDHSGALVTESGGRDTILLTTPLGCVWTATSGCSWLSILTPSSGSGNTSIIYEVAPNPDFSPRTCVLVIAGIQFTVTQDGQDACQYLLQPAFDLVPASGGNKSFSVTTAQTTCSWTVSSSCSWVKISGNTGVGNGVVFYQVEPNLSAAQRSCTITVGDALFQVSQEGASGCAFLLNPSNSSFVASGGTTTFTITASQLSCTWTAQSTCPWASVVNNSGSGNATVQVLVQANSSTTARSCGIIAGGSVHTIDQAGSLPGCTYSILPTAGNASGGGDTLTFAVTANTGCVWSLNLNGCSFITAVGQSSGSGNGTIKVYVSANTGSSLRSCIINIAGQSVQVNQSVCVMQISPPAATICEGESAQLNALGTSGYSWTPATGLSSTTNATVIASPTQTTTYFCSGFNGSCPVTTPVVVTVNPKPLKPVIEKAGNTLATGTATSHQWYKEGVLIAGATAQFYTATQSGFYTVVITDVNGCKNTSDVLNFTLNGIKNIRNSLLKVFPNPSNGLLAIESSMQIGAFTIELKDLSGRNVHSEFVNARKALINLQSLEKGIYILQVKAKGELLHMEKLVLQ